MLFSRQFQVLQLWLGRRTMEQLMSDWESVSERLGTGTRGILILVTVFVVGSGLWLLRAQNGNGKKARGTGTLVQIPPGAVGLPYVIWDTLAFLKANRRNDLKSFFSEKAARYGPIFKLSILGETVVLLDPPAGNKFIFAMDYELFQKSYPKSVTDLSPAKCLLFLNGEAHKTVRRHLASRFLGPEPIRRYVRNMERNVLEHFEKHWLGKEDTGEEICTHDTITKYSLGLILDLCFGITIQTKKAEVEKMSHAFVVWAHGLLSLPINLPGFTFHRSLKAKAVLDGVIDDLIVQRKQELKEGAASPDRDMLSVLLSQPDDSGQIWSDEEIRDNLLLLLFAGHDTSASTLTLTLSNVAKHPEVYQKLIDEHRKIVAKKSGDALTMDDVLSMTYTWRVVQETMRITTIVPLGFRQATQEFKYKGFTVFKGWKLMWSQDRMNRESAFFTNPESFDPSRFTTGGGAAAPYVFVPFGAGPRCCPGQEFARIEILIFLHHFVRKFEWSLTDPDEKVLRVYEPRTKKGSPIRIAKCKAF